jgi:hypothetical protein
MERGRSRVRAAGYSAGLLLGAIGGAATAQVAPQDFRLPPSRPTPTPTGPEQEGPVAPDLPGTRPTVTPTSAPTVTPQATAPVVVVPPAATPTPTPAPAATRSPPAPPRTPAPEPADTTDPVDIPAVAEPSPVPTVPPPSPGVTPLPAAPVTEQPAATRGPGGFTWLGWLVLAALASIGLWLVLRRRTRARQRDAEVPVPPPAPARPSPVPAPPPPVRTPAPPAPPVPAPPVLPSSGLPPLTGLNLNIVPERLSLSLMNAALTCRLTVVNERAEPLEGFTMVADLTGAHGGVSTEEQLGGPAADAREVINLPQLAPAEEYSTLVDLRLPLSAVPAIRQGQAALFVPLLRLALSASGHGRRTATVLVGPPGQNGQVQPVRLDAGPRVLTPLAARALA